ncbi:MAG: M56 family metallopeptidase [Planctomycetes bacterium]|nr:M56 family metallopeptidase [Planctomycetota bacterium]
MFSQELYPLFSMLESAGAWILTYLLHSTVLLGLFWLIVRWRRFDATVFNDTVWKFAVAGGLITAFVQSVSGIEPWSGRFQLKEPAAITASLQEDREDIPKIEFLKPVAGDVLEDTCCMMSEPCPGASVKECNIRTTCAGPLPCTPCDSCERDVPMALIPASTLTIKEDKAGALPQWAGALFNYWPLWLVGFCGSLSLMALVRLVKAWHQLRRLLRGRKEITSGPLPDLLDGLCRKAGYRRPVRLTVSSKALVPLAFGIFKPEICIPERACSHLGAAQQKSMLAHELAHLARRDPVWLIYFRVIESLLVFQPLNHMSRQRWLEAVEYQCDAWAARLLGGGMHLARCLTQVAEWILDPPNRLLRIPVHGMAQQGHTLTRRVSRLLDPACAGEHRGLRPLSVLVLPLALWLVTFGAPGVGVQAEADTVTGVGKKLTLCENYPCEDCPHNDRTQEPTLAHDIAALDRELAQVEMEVKTIRSILEEAGLGPWAAPSIQEMEQLLASMKQKRRCIQEWIRQDWIIDLSQ